VQFVSGPLRFRVVHQEVPQVGTVPLDDRLHCLSAVMPVGCPDDQADLGVQGQFYSIGPAQDGLAVAAQEAVSNAVLEHQHDAGTLDQ
jgi:hypothetical protein